MHNLANELAVFVDDNNRKKASLINIKSPIYGVPWIEIDFGERNEGWALFVDLEMCKKETKKASDKGSGHGYYIGPVRPLCYFEISLDSLGEKLLENLKLNGKVHTDNNWSPKYRDSGHEIR